MLYFGGLLLLMLLYLTLYYRKRYLQHKILAYDYMRSNEKLSAYAKIYHPPVLTDDESVFRDFILNHYGVKSLSLMHRESELIDDFGILRCIYHQKSGKISRS